jgi:hypothetical protein
VPKGAIGIILLQGEESSTMAKVVERSGPRNAERKWLGIRTFWLKDVLI